MLHDCKVFKQSLFHRFTSLKAVKKARDFCDEMDTNEIKRLTFLAG
jgi:hypothetical protein